MSTDDSGTFEILKNHRPPHLSADDIDRIAETAAKKALQKVYAEIGQSVLRKMAWLLGIALLGLLMWLGTKNALPRP
jgi:hypothetical protein